MSKKPILNQLIGGEMFVASATADVVRAADLLFTSESRRVLRAPGRC